MLNEKLKPGIPQNFAGGIHNGQFLKLAQYTCGAYQNVHIEEKNSYLILNFNCIHPTSYHGSFFQYGRHQICCICMLFARQLWIILQGWFTNVFSPTFIDVAILFIKIYQRYLHQLNNPYTKYDWLPIYFFLYTALNSCILKIMHSCTRKLQ